MKEQYKKYTELVDKHKQLILDTERYLWKHPQVGYKEWEATEYLVRQYEKMGFQVKTAEGIPGFIADSGAEELSIDLTMRSDGGVELKYTASTSVNEEAALRIDYTFAGNSSRMTAKGTVQVRNVCDVTFDAAVSVRTTSEKPLTAPPAGATIITLPPVMPIAA